MRSVAIATLFFVAPVVSNTARGVSNDADAAFSAIRDAYLVKYKPLWLEAQTAWWEANTTGSDAAFDRKKAADNALVTLHADHGVFAQLKSFKDADRISEPALRRELEVMYTTFKPGQADPDLQKQIVDIANDVEQTFNTHRSKVGDKSLTENEVREVLSKTGMSTEAEAAWKGYMQVGTKVESRLRKLVELRNKMARELGYKNYHAMRLDLQEIDEAAFFALFAELDELTREPFSRLKRDIDAAQAKRFSIPASDLHPWHFGDLFFQDAPDTQGVNLDQFFEGADLIALTKKYYAGFGLPCDGIVARSDLYERPGKSPHAFCNDMDREGDIRVLCNVKPNLYWADTLLHEIGHAVYDKYIRRDVPFLLRTASHSITTEGIAMMFGAMVKNKDWLINVRELDASQADEMVHAAAAALRAEKVLFSRWTQVVVHFEHGMYTNPDQDLGKLWWGLKKRFQLLDPPETVNRPDYAAKVHILTYPVYYHSYLMGDLFAAQVHDYIARTVLNTDPAETSFYGQRAAGVYLRDKVFGPGNLYSWNELTKRATGEPLTAKYFARRFVK